LKVLSILHSDFFKFLRKGLRSEELDGSWIVGSPVFKIVVVELVEEGGHDLKILIGGGKTRGRRCSRFDDQISEVLIVC
jgi:hypothetical protein